MFKIEEHALYSKRDLADALKDVCHVETFLRRVRPNRVLKNVYYGRDILAALARLSSAGEDETESLDAPTRIGSSSRRVRGKAPAIPLERILIK